MVYFATNVLIKFHFRNNSTTAVYHMCISTCYVKFKYKKQKKRA